MPFGIGRSLKKHAKSIFIGGAIGSVTGASIGGIEASLGPTIERVGKELERFGGKVVSEKYKKDLRRARDISVRGFTHQLNPIPTVEGSAASVLGPAGYTYLGYKEEMEEEEQKDYERAQKREAEQRVKAEAERGQEMLRRRRLRRLGNVYASGFGSSSTEFKTVLGI